MPITLSNGHKIEWMVASGALAFDGRGWMWDWPYMWAGLLDPKLFTVVGKSLTLQPRQGNLRWHKPWECVRHISGGTVNKVGLTNPGFTWWFENVGPRFHDKKLSNFIVSLFGTKDELIQMARLLNGLRGIAGIEVNVSCPNTGHEMDEVEAIIDTAHVIRSLSIHPILLKLGVDQQYVTIAQGVRGAVEGIGFNSVKWEIVFPAKPSPLSKLEKRVRGGGGGVSGRAAQRYNWDAVRLVKKQVPDMPVIAPSIWNYEDVEHVLNYLEADAVSFGAIHLKVPFGPMLPTRYVRRWRREHGITSKQKGND